jgi:hypothetical protein
VETSSRTDTRAERPGVTAGGGAEVLEAALAKVAPEQYGADYRAHLLDQYKLYVEMADRISARRQTANAFFLSLNTALLAFLGLAAERDTGDVPLPWVLAVTAAGLVLCFTWYRLVRSYRDLNGGKFRVIHAIERRLPLAPYDAEWESVGRGEDPRLYLPFTHIEIRVPWVFAALHAGFAAWSVAQSAGWG